MVSILCSMKVCISTIYIALKKKKKLFGIMMVKLNIEFVTFFYTQNKNKLFGLRPKNYAVLQHREIIHVSDGDGARQPSLPCLTRILQRTYRRLMLTELLNVHPGYLYNSVSVRKNVA